MNKLSNRVVVAVALLAATGIGFSIGRMAGVRAEQLTHTQRDTYLNAMNALARYKLFSELSQYISAKRHGKAQCTSDLMASANLNEVRACLESERCRGLIDAEIRARAPELLAPETKLPFRYYADRELCNPAQ